MMSRPDERLFAKFNGNSPATLADILAFELASNFELPRGYAEFLQRMNGGEGFIGPTAYIIFWRLEELSELNEAYQVNEYAPGLFVFGSDGGGEAFAFDTRSPIRPIVAVPFVGMDLVLARPMANSFEEFLVVLSSS